MSPKTVYRLAYIVVAHVTDMVLGLGDWKVAKLTQDGYDSLVLDFDLPKLVSLRLDVTYLIKSFNLLGKF